MPSRHKQRELALQLTYAIEMTGDDFNDALFKFQAREPSRKKQWDEFAEALTTKAMEQAEDINEKLRKALEHWRLERLSKIDRAMLRLAVCEMKSFDDIPIRVTINEWIEIAKQYGGDESPTFINGVLDKIARAYSDKDNKPVSETE